MGRLPPGVLIMIVALLSASAGALFMWAIGYAIGGKEDRTTERSPRRDPPASGPGELLRVSRSRKGLVVSVQGKPLHHLREITDPQVGQETVEAVRAVLGFAEGWLPALQEQQPGSPSTSTPSVVDKSALSKPTPGTVPTIVSRAPLLSSSEPLRLVEEIDALVQERLRARPDLAEKRIRLTHHVDGSILIYVGQQRYRSATDIPDEAVRAFIRDAIRAWEDQ